MRAVVQRVKNASVSISDKIVGECEIGALILVCAMKNDTISQVENLQTRLPRSEYTKMKTKNEPLLMDINGSALVISQFTLASDLKRGNRPGFSEAAEPEKANIFIIISYLVLSSLEYLLKLENSEAKWQYI